MIYIIGVNHEQQCLKDDSNEISQNFYELINDYYEEYNFDILLEEYNEDAKLKWDCSETVLEKIANENNLIHEFCDPGIEERKNRGFYSTHSITTTVYYGEGQEEAHSGDDTTQFDSMREDIWIEYIKKYDPYKNIILFVCGNTHLDNLETKFSVSAWEYIILDSE